MEFDSSVRPLCFVLMPFGRKPDSSGRILDFDAIYETVIRPAVVAAELEPLRGDEEQIGGLIHRPMFERLILCPFAVADLTTANANVYYELGIRHAFRPHSTALLFAGDAALPFDLSPVRAIPYAVDGAGRPAEVATMVRKITAALAHAVREAQGGQPDSPVYQLLEGLPVPDVSRLKTDVFRERSAYSAVIKGKLAAARAEGQAAVVTARSELGDLSQLEAGILIDLLLSYRAVSDHQGMVDLAEAFPAPVAATVMVREQRAFALNRLGRDAEAEAELRGVIASNGPSSETCGLLGRIYKDRWTKAVGQGDASASGHLKSAVETYLQGFQTDWRDHYPGINCVTLMELMEPPDPRRLELVPVVRYSVKRRLAAADADYWDHATLLQLAVLGDDGDDAKVALADALAALREPWEAETTARDLALINQARERHGTLRDWHTAVHAELASRGPADD